MPIRSMTGFGLAENVSPSGVYRVEIRAVNNRFQELQIRQPKFMLNLEPRIKKEIAAGGVSRGSVSVFISCDREEKGGAALAWDRDAVDAYMKIFLEIKDRMVEDCWTYHQQDPDYDIKHKINFCKESLGMDPTVKFTDVIRQGDIIKGEVTEFPDEEVWAHLQPALAGAVKAFQESRETEGAQLAADLRNILADIEAALSQVEARAPERVREYGASLTARVEKLLQTSEFDQQRIATEVSLMAERLDISEEIVRLKAHIKKFSDDLNLDEPIGKRMGFLLQEMNREANTIGSKANDTQIAHISVSLKESIEKIREQIQNIE